MWTTALWDHHPMTQLQWGAVIGTSLVGALWDLAVRRIPNPLVFGALLAGLTVAGLVKGPAGVGDALAGMCLLALPFLLLFLCAGGGAGDAKLMGALGSWLGVCNSTVLLVAVTAMGVLVGLGFAVAHKRLGTVTSNLRRMIWSALFFMTRQGRWEQARALLPQKQEMMPVPYGLAIFLGTCAAAGGVFLWRS